MENEQFNELVKSLKDNGCTNESIRSFIVNNYDFLSTQDKSIIDKLFFLYNGKNLYALIIVEDDNYMWSNLENDEFTKLMNSNDEDGLRDFVIEDMLRFGEDGKFDHIVPGLKDGYLKNIRVLQKTKFNSNGYYIK